MAKVGPESSAFDSADECVEANSSEGSDRGQHSLRLKKRTGFGPHQPQQQGLRPQSAFFRLKKRTGFGPHHGQGWDGIFSLRSGLNA